MSEEQASPAQDGLAVYDSVQTPNRPGSASQTGSIGRPTAAGPASAPSQPPSMGVTMVLLAVLLVGSLVLVVAGLAMGQAETSKTVPVVAISMGGSLLAWHIRSLISGSGRRTAQVSRWPWVGLMVVAAFGAVTGFALFDLLTGVRTAARIALLVGGVVGLIAGVVAYIRDSDLQERARNAPLPAPEPAPEPAPGLEAEPVPRVFFDPTGEPDALRPRGVWPLPKRGSAADASLWEEPIFDDEAPPRRARRGE